jgi:hypothetical protein
LKISSANFDFLARHDAQLLRLGALAERYFRDDPNTCLIKLRQFGEVLAQLVAAKAGLYRSPDEPQADLLRRLNLDRITPREVGDLFYQLRVTGNRATHDLSGTHDEALTGLKVARQLGIWGLIQLPDASQRPRSVVRKHRCGLEEGIFAQLSHFRSALERGIASSAHGSVQWRYPLRVCADQAVDGGCLCGWVSRV